MNIYIIWTNTIYTLISHLVSYMTPGPGCGSQLSDACVMPVWFAMLKNKTTEIDQYKWLIDSILYQHPTQASMILGMHDIITLRTIYTILSLQKL